MSSLHLDPCPSGGRYMKAIIRRASLCVASLVLGLFAAHARAQTTPAVQGTSIADPAVPVVITTAPAGSGFFVLNQDYSVLQHSTVDTSQIRVVLARRSTRLPIRHSERLSRTSTTLM